jgi:acyl-coenzyme A thioesterase PaaI-like protein
VKGCEDAAEGYEDAPVGPIPEQFGGYFDALEEQASEADAEMFHQCFGCGPAHPTGLRVRRFRKDGGVVSPILIAREYEGPPGTAHGGIVAAYMDEVLAGAVTERIGRSGVTGELTVRYVRPVPTARPLIGRAQATGVTERYVDVEGVLEEFGTGAVVATARGRFFPDAGVTRPGRVL